MQRSGCRPRAGRQLGDHGVQRRRALLQALVSGKQLEIRDLARAPAFLDLLDQLERPAQQRAVDVREHRLLGLALAHDQVAVDAGVGLGGATVELDQPVDRAVEVVRVEAVERLDRHRRRREHLAGQRDEDAAVASLGQRVRDREVGDGGGEEHRAVGLLRPQEAEDVGSLARIGQVGEQAPDPFARPAVELPDVERAATADEDPPRRQVVGAEVHERADGALLAHDRRDQRLVDPVLQGDDESVRVEPRCDGVESRRSVLRLDGQEDGTEAIRQPVGRDCGSRDRELLDGPLDRQAMLVHRRHVFGIGVAEEHRPAVADKSGTDGAADCPGSHEDVVVR